jgi:hypothetical protein
MPATPDATHPAPGRAGARKGARGKGFRLRILQAVPDHPGWSVGDVVTVSDLEAARALVGYGYAEPVRPNKRLGQPGHAWLVDPQVTKPEKPKS